MVIYPPHPIPHSGTALFLAGSIEMGNAPDWQSEVIQNLQGEDLIILNPRRADWDSSWEQHKDAPLFREQVEWELNGLERADLIVMYLHPATQSPISLLELGLFAQSQKLIVCCPEGFWRKGNVDIVCERYNVPQVSNLTALILEIRQKLG